MGLPNRAWCRRTVVEREWVDALQRSSRSKSGPPFRRPPTESRIRRQSGGNVVD